MLRDTMLWLRQSHGGSTGHGVTSFIVISIRWVMLHDIMACRFRHVDDIRYLLGVSVIFGHVIVLNVGLEYLIKLKRRGPGH